MRNRLIAIVMLALLAGGLAFSIHYGFSVRPMLALVHQPQGEMEWLRQAYHLTDDQYQRICVLHCAYVPRCEEMCQERAAQQTRLTALIKANREITPEVREAMNATAALESKCKSALLEHLYAVAAAMTPSEGNRYLAEMTPLITSSGMPMKPAKKQSCP